MNELACQTRLTALTWGVAEANLVRAEFAERGILTAAPEPLNC
jgi:hypothetical protein